jgi:hypothetical protein
MTTTKLYNYKNGNSNITIFSDGTRIIEYANNLELEYPLNIDIRVSTKCAFGKTATGSAVCSFCHESAVVDGIECDYDSLYSLLSYLPHGVELAIGSNELTDKLIAFLELCKNKWIVNLTLNQGHIKRDIDNIRYVIANQLIHGLGISYRPNMVDIPKELIDYPNMVVHVIAGIDTVDEIKSLSIQGVKKILILGEKDFGFNSGHVNLNSLIHHQWKYQLHRLINLFDVVSFDNLALQQLNVQSRLTDDDWNTFYQGEYSFYIDAVNQTFSRSSRSSFTRKWKDITAYDYFKSAM